MFYYELEVTSKQKRALSVKAAAEGLCVSTYCLWQIGLLNKEELSRVQKLRAAFKATQAKTADLHGTTKGRLPSYIPTEDEIAEETAKLRETWDEKEDAKRYYKNEQNWVAPVVPVPAELANELGSE